MSTQLSGALNSFSPDQLVQFAATQLASGGPGLLAQTMARLMREGRPDLAAHLANAANFAATMNGRPDIKQFIEGGGLAGAVRHILFG